MIKIFPDSDMTQSIAVQDTSQFDSLEAIIEFASKNLNLPPDFKPYHYGLKTKQQSVLLAQIGDIVKSKKQKGTMEAFQTDGKEYYDDHLNVDNLILRDLGKEA